MIINNVFTMLMFEHISSNVLSHAPKVTMHIPNVRKMKLKHLETH